MRGDAKRITNLIKTHGVTLTGATPSEYLSWLQYGEQNALASSSWKFAISGGESLPQGRLCRTGDSGK